MGDKSSIMRPAASTSEREKGDKQASISGQKANGRQVGDKARTSLASCDGVSSKRQAADKPETGRKQIKDYLA